MTSATLSLVGWLFVQHLAMANPSTDVEEFDPGLPFSDVISTDKVRLSTRLPKQIEVHPIAGEIVLQTKQPKKLARELRQKLEKTACPKAKIEAGAVRLSCNIRKMKAKVSRRRGRNYLEISELRSMPELDDESKLPFFPLEPQEFGIGGACPGDTAASRGECAFQAGELTKAAEEFREALKSDSSRQRELASLRLGDLALKVGDVDSARGWFMRAGKSGPIARLAYVRTCEIEGSCFAPLDGHRHQYYPYDLSGTSAAVREEIALRAVRAYTFEGNPEAAARILIEEGYKPCDLQADLCVAVEREALREQNRPSVLAMAIYLTSPLPRTEAAVWEHATLAAEHAAAMGAPSYGASLLAATLNLAGKKKLERHLLRSAELYLDADDRARARAVVRYAEQNVEKKRRSFERRWTTVRERLVSEPPVTADIERIRSEVPAELKEARKLIDSAKGIVSQGAKK